MDDASVPVELPEYIPDNLKIKEFLTNIGKTTFVLCSGHSILSDRLLLKKYQSLPDLGLKRRILKYIYRPTLFESGKTAVQPVNIGDSVDDVRTALGLDSCIVVGQNTVVELDSAVLQKYLDYPVVFIEKNASCEFFVEYGNAKETVINVKVVLFAESLESPAKFAEASMKSKVQEALELVDPNLTFVIDWENVNWITSPSKLSNQIISLPSLDRIQLILSKRSDIVQTYERVAESIPVEQMSRIFQIVDSISHKLEVRENQKKNTPFVFVAAPSRSGKTQLTMSLDLYSKYRWKQIEPLEGNVERPAKFLCVLRFIVQSFTVPELQPIYNDIVEYSRDLLAILQSDYEKIRDLSKCQLEQEVVAGSTLWDCKNSPLKSIGIIIALLKARIEGKDYPKPCGRSEINLGYKPLSILQGLNEVKHLRETNDNLPVLVALDEFNTKHLIQNSVHGKSTYLMFLRNILRELGIHVFLLGTHSSAANLSAEISLGGPLSRSEPCDWAYVVRDLPPATPDTIPQLTRWKNEDPLLASKFVNPDDFSKLREYLLEVAPTAGSEEHLRYSRRNGFSSLFTEELNAILDKSANGSQIVAPLLDEVLLGTNTKLRSTKLKSMSTAEGRAGQFAATVAVFRQQDERHLRPITLPDSLMHHHYASFALSDEKVVTDSTFLVRRETDGTLVGYPGMDAGMVKFSWNAKCVYYRFSEDELFYLMCLEIKDTPMVPGYTARAVAEEAHRTLGMKVSTYLTPLVRRRDGFYLENIMGFALVAASRYSLGGQYLPEFLERLIHNLQTKPWDIVLDDKHLLGEASNVLVPFIPVINASLSEKFQNLGPLYTGTLRLVADKERCDGIIRADIQAVTLEEEKKELEFEISFLKRWKRLDLKHWQKELEADLEDVKLNISERPEINQERCQKQDERFHRIKEAIGNPQALLAHIRVESKNLEKPAGVKELSGALYRMLEDAYDPEHSRYGHFILLLFVSQFANLTNDSLKKIYESIPNLTILKICRFDEGDTIDDSEVDCISDLDLSQSTASEEETNTIPVEKALCLHTVQSYQLKKLKPDFSIPTSDPSIKEDDPDGLAQHLRRESMRQPNVIEGGRNITAIILPLNEFT